MIKKKISAIAALLVLGSVSVYGGTITGSPHDLTATGMSDVSATTNPNGEICVFCHTPHAGNSAFVGAPLWNKADIATTTFTMYGAADASSAGSTIAQATTAIEPSNSSLACLSCHDGASAIDSIVNAPGAGLNTPATAASILIGTIGGNANASLTADLTNTHPISIDYIAGNASLRPTGDTLTGTWQGATLISDLLRSGKVECGSCHDPHNGTALDATARAAEVNFLRHSNTNSALCLGCHDK